MSIQFTGDVIQQLMVMDDRFMEPTATLKKEFFRDSALSCSTPTRFEKSTNVASGSCRQLIGKAISNAINIVHAGRDFERIRFMLPLLTQMEHRVK